MNTVQPIKDRQTIEKFKTCLLKRSYRDYMLFVLGINTGFRIADMLKLQVKQVLNSHITIREDKTNKEKRALINTHLRQELDKYTQGMEPEEYLFQSRKGENRPITRIQAYRVINEAGRSLGLEEVGTHTLRKTFGYWHYRRHKDVALLQNLFNHSAPSVTLRYIGINQDMMDETMKEFFL